MTSSHTPPSLRLAGAPDDPETGFWSVTRALLIGRERADITLAVPCLSRRHAEVTHDGSTCLIRDLGSRNGTDVNGERLSGEPRGLRHGDVVVLAGAIELHFDDPSATPFAPRLGRLNGLWTDPDAHDAWVDARKVVPPLSGRQLAFLRVVESAGGRVVSRDELVARLWPEHAAGSVSDDAVDSLIKRVRRRLAPFERRGPVLEILRGRGVRLRPDR